MEFVILTATLTILSVFGGAAAVDTPNGERVGGCPSPPEVSIGLEGAIPLDDACHVDADCTGNPVHKCCPDQTGINVCVNPVPACRDGMRIYAANLLDGTCAEKASTHCIDRGCEDGPSGPGGWTAACCGGYPFEWAGTPRPSCSGDSSPIKDSEGEYYWCEEGSVRSCPNNSACVTDVSGYQICCPSPDCANVGCPGGFPSCGDGYELVDKAEPGSCCPNLVCVETNCANVACPAGFPSCGDGYELVDKAEPGSCCPNLVCVETNCANVACPAGFPSCGDGYELVDKAEPGSCCPNLVCVETNCANVACPAGFPSCGDGYELVDKAEPGSCCPNLVCVKTTVCTPGEYYSEPGRPCEMCECGSDGTPTDMCMVVDCVNPECPPGTKVKHRPDECCGYDCVDEACAYTNYVCSDDVPVCRSGFKLEKSYVPGDCCPKHKCVQTNCSHVGCVMPFCAAGATIRKTERSGMCCPLVECVSSKHIWIKDGKLTTVSIVAVALAAIIIIGGVVTAVGCCVMHRRKQPGEKQAYNNLAYVDAGAVQKVPIPAGGGVVVGVEDVKTNKEKEAFQNV